MIRAGVMGAAGYAGIELVRLLSRHPDFELVLVTSNAEARRRVDQVYPALVGVSDLVFSPHESVRDTALDVVFLALPHKASMSWVPGLLERGISVMDLSADFRLKDRATYEKWYETLHVAPELLAKAAYGLPELFAAELAARRREVERGEPALVACPGCYPTASTLAAWPIVAAGLAADGVPIVVDAISGVTGAGKKPTSRTHYCNANENVEAYGVAGHRHTPEIEQNLAAAAAVARLAGKNVTDPTVVFTPHLAPLSRGLLSTVTIKLNQQLSTDALRDLYANYYEDKEAQKGGADKSFVHLLPKGAQPRTASVAGTNEAHLTVISDQRTGCAIATCAIDNLEKGAAGQAVQCANIVYGLRERRGFDMLACAI